jgi:hypothetical protein
MNTLGKRGLYGLLVAGTVLFWTSGAATAAEDTAPGGTFDGTVLVNSHNPQECPNDPADPSNDPADPATPAEEPTNPPEDVPAEPADPADPADPEPDPADPAAQCPDGTVAGAGMGTGGAAGWEAGASGWDENGVGFGANQGLYLDTAANAEKAGLESSNAAAPGLVVAVMGVLAAFAASVLYRRGSHSS